MIMTQQMRFGKLRFAFLGTQGTGKTTAVMDLATRLKKAGYDVDVVTEVARKSPYPINEGATLQSQLWIFANMLNQEIISKADITIYDRTLLDVLEYTFRISHDDAELLRPFIQEWMKTYDLLFYMEPRRGYLKKDGKRSTDKKFQKVIKDMMETDIEAMQLPVVRLKTCPQRYLEAMKVINNKDANRMEVKKDGRRKIHI
jgi:nicotinamide riboside kinase